MMKKVKLQKWWLEQRYIRFSVDFPYATMVEKYIAQLYSTRIGTIIFMMMRLCGQFPSGWLTESHKGPMNYRNFRSAKLLIEIPKTFLKVS